MAPGARAQPLLPVAEPIPVLTRLTAAELTLGRSVTACLDTAAELHGFSTHRDPDTHVLGDARSTLGALKVHRMPPIRPLRQRRFAAVDPAETAVRLAAAAANPPRALAVLDAALRSASSSREMLAAVADESHLTRIGLVRTLVPLADPRAESPPESWLRWVCHDAGFPPPEPQFWVQCANERWIPTGSGLAPDQAGAGVRRRRVPHRPRVDQRPGPAQRLGGPGLDRAVSDGAHALVRPGRAGPADRVRTPTPRRRRGLS